MTSVALRMNVNIVVAKTMAGRLAPTLPTRDSSSPLAACSGVRS